MNTATVPIPKPRDGNTDGTDETPKPEEIQPPIAPINTNGPSVKNPCLSVPLVRVIRVLFGRIQPNGTGCLLAFAKLQRSKAAYTDVMNLHGSNALTIKAADVPEGTKDGNTTALKNPATDGTDGTDETPKPE